ncbi:epithelial cell-transforming sequence 2 oncogene-like [Lytechinus variegatus]|uniref:epithelial cell-transforming sequence 2 oncogene-like n=1 Tax=Lytechinus variegatus TaxID=7654 RepID=UPI001BB12536|nr:epithelial cell-transforming sequence 2 oncogene-like [Lytechinus variegatus]
MSNSPTKSIPRPRTNNPLSRSLPASTAGASGTAPVDRVLHYRAEHAGDRSLRKTAQVSPLQMSTPSMRTGTTFKTNKLQTKHSTWTPILHKPSNEQLYLERRDLTAHWFDLWTDSQRKRFLQFLLVHCKRSQLVFLQQFFDSKIPLTHVDFTKILPRFLCLYIFSFLDPRSLSRASMVCWHWKFVTEQDELWVHKCLRHGWLLPYVPRENEFGAWKKHYIKCFKSLDVTQPNEKSDRYGKLGDGSTLAEKEYLRKLKAGRIKEPPLNPHPYAERGPWLDPDPRPQDTEKAFKSMADTANPTFGQPLPKVHQRSWTEPARNFEYGLESGNRKQQHRVNQDVEETIGNDRSLATSLSACIAVELSENPDKINRSWAKPQVQPVSRRPDLSRGGDYSAFKKTSKHDVGSKVIRGESPFRILLISSEVPAYQLLVSAAKPDVLPIVYEYNGSTIESLLTLLQATVGSYQARSIGLFTLGEDSVRIIRETAITSRMIEHPDIKNFWESFSQCIESAKEGGSLDFFAPLEATAGGHEMMSRLSSLIGLRLSSPATLSPTRFDYVTGEWQDTAHTRPNPPPHSLYFQAAPLQAWQALAGRVAEATTRCSEDLRGFFVQRREQLLHRVTGDVVLEELGEDGLGVCDQVMVALREALEELARHPDQENPAAFLGETLLKISGQGAPHHQGMNNGISGAPRQSNKMSGLKLASESQDDMSIGEEIEEEIEEEYEEESEQELIRPAKSRPEPINSKTFLRTHSKPSTVQQTFQSMQLTTPPGKTHSERRRAVANEILDAEKVYLRRLNIIHNVYFERLAAALRSNHAIIGQTNISLIFTDTNNILNVTRGLYEELKGRLESWSAQQCLGDCFVKFQSKLKAYTNFHNNYAIILSTIDKCREQEPSFRAFLKQHDSSASSEMMTLDELMLGVAHHIHHYNRLLLAFHHATPDDHPDKEDLMTAIQTFRQLQDLIDQNKQRGERERVLKGLQKRIVGCPSLLEANRFLVRQETVALMESVTNSSKTNNMKGPMKHVNDLCLFLFNDALVVTHEGSRHVPYTRRSETFYKFIVALSLTRLQVQDVPDSKYVQHGILLVSPKKRLLCSAEDYSSKVALLSILEETIRAALDVD